MSFLGKAIWALSLVAIAGCNQQQDIDTLRNEMLSFQEASLLIEEKRFRKALDVLTPLSPRYDDTRYFYSVLLAKAHWGLRHAEEAQQALTVANKIQPGVVENYVLSAEIWKTGSGHTLSAEVTSETGSGHTLSAKKQEADAHVQPD